MARPSGAAWAENEKARKRRNEKNVRTMKRRESNVGEEGFQAQGLPATSAPIDSDNKKGRLQKRPPLG